MTQSSEQEIMRVVNEIQDVIRGPLHKYWGDDFSDDEAFEGSEEEKAIRRSLYKLWARFQTAEVEWILAGEDKV